MGSCNFVSIRENLLMLIYSKLYSKSCDYQYKWVRQYFVNIMSSRNNSFLAKSCLNNQKSLNQLLQETAKECLNSLQPIYGEMFKIYSQTNLL